MRNITEQKSACITTYTRANGQNNFSTVDRLAEIILVVAGAMPFILAFQKFWGVF